jgi:hypothetical protein
VCLIRDVGRARVDHGDRRKVRGTSTNCCECAYDHGFGGPQGPPPRARLIRRMHLLLARRERSCVNDARNRG